MPRQPPDQFRVQFLRNAIQVFLSKLEVGLALQAGTVSLTIDLGKVSRHKDSPGALQPVLEGYFCPFKQLLGLLGVFRRELPSEYIVKQIIGDIIDSRSRPANPSSGIFRSLG